VVVVVIQQVYVQTVMVVMVEMVVVRQELVVVLLTLVLVLNQVLVVVEQHRQLELVEQVAQVLLVVRVP
jgi:hypothetical protein